MPTASDFVEAFRPKLVVELLAPGIANVTDRGVTLLVQAHYCAHCNAIHGYTDDGAGMCRHKVALFEAEHANDADDADARETNRLEVAVQ